MSGFELYQNCTLWYQTFYCLI